ncbi:MAG: hypothetical protein J3K34DRAFT_519579 [Monoraphidium minutum]|nr:MAG: hypothetical protein J3K34DRAFT_519579 [Monoraphidium minutum]
MATRRFSAGTAAAAAGSVVFLVAAAATVTTVFWLWPLYCLGGGSLELGPAAQALWRVHHNVAWVPGCEDNAAQGKSAHGDGEAAAAAFESPTTAAFRRSRLEPRTPVPQQPCADDD